MTTGAAETLPSFMTVEVFGGSDARFAEAMEIRRRVFVVEQGVPIEEELDAMDAVSTHLLIRVDGEAAGTLRFFDDEGWLHVGRVAVLSDHRSRKLGVALMERCLAEGKARGMTHSFLNSQTYALGFYAKFGYQRVGEEFMEAGIPHCRLEAAL